MEQVNPPVRFSLGGREVTLVYNPRALRLIKERAGLRIGPGLDPQDLYDNVGCVFWALTQNLHNGTEAQWPAFEWVEEHLPLDQFEHLSGVLGQAMRKEKPKDGTEGNGNPEASPSNSSTSGPSQPLT